MQQFSAGKFILQKVSEIVNRVIVSNAFYVNILKLSLSVYRDLENN